MATKYKCVVCGKLTAGRKTFDDAERWPRRHKGKDGEPCPGNIVATEEWIEVEQSQEAEDGR